MCELYFSGFGGLVMWIICGCIGFLLGCLIVCCGVTDRDCGIVFLL